MFDFQQGGMILKKYLPILKNSPFFTGLTDNEILSILHCVKATAVSQKRDSYIFRAGDSTEVMGLVVSGCVLVIQEDQYLAGVAQLIDQFVLDFGVVAQEAEDSPDGSGHEQRDGRFVDFRFVLERDEQVAHHEKQNHCRYHSVRIIKSTMVAKLINCPVFRLSNWAFFEVRIGFWDFFIYLCRRFRANV